MTTPAPVTAVARVRPIRLRRNWAAQWRMENPVLAAAEIGVELDTGRFKIGDGVTRWKDLPYFAPNQEGDSPIQGVTLAYIQSEIQKHIDALDPHPSYDDGPSLLLLYENSKV